jgi:hypothetical protein
MDFCIEKQGLAIKVIIATSSNAFGVHGNTSPVSCVISVPSSYPHPLGLCPPETGQCVVVPGGRLSAVGQNHFFALAGFLAAGFLATAFALAGAFAFAFTFAFAGAFATAFALALVGFAAAFTGAFTGVFVLAGAFAAAFAGFAGTFFAVAIRTSSLSNI